MTPGLTSIIIPTYNHARYLPESIDCALAQTAPVEVLVVDDASTDDTTALLASITDSRVRYFRLPHGGPARARNHGIDQARGEFIQFLDADDIIEPTKVELQRAIMDADAGFVFCDTRIIGVDGSVVLASERYQYATIRKDGWIEPWLTVRNFIPIHAPLTRRAAIGDLRFPLDVVPEDWHFWHALSLRARCRYTPGILATYRKRRGGRNVNRDKHLQTRPALPKPLVLNLGCGNPDARSWHPMPHCLNLDKSLGWSFEDGLTEFDDGQVDGITISHALMYVHAADWPDVFAEFARVLRPGGVIRITEDDTTHPDSRTFRRGWHDHATLTGPAMVRQHLHDAGFTVHDVQPGTTHYRDDTLRQSQHGEPPHVFYVEGVRECPLLLSPHADDETLFAAFTIIRYRPQVVICYPSSGDYGDTETRLSESRAAVAILGGGQVHQWDGTDLAAKMRAIDERLRPTIVFAPSDVTSHPEHAAVAAAAAEVFRSRLHRFHTYRNGEKVRAGNPVPFEPGWPELKRQALACYVTQRAHLRAAMFFDESRFDLPEFAE